MAFSDKVSYRCICTSSGISLRDFCVSLSKPKHLTSVCLQCGGGGELVSCTGCNKTFHADCLKVPSIPESNYELQCSSFKDMNHKIESRRASSIQSQVASKPVKLDLKPVLELPKDIGRALCEDSAFEIGNEFSPRSFIFCGQCERLYHVGCLKDHGMCDLQKRPMPWFSWLCSIDRKEVRKDLKCLVNSSPHDFHISLASKLKNTSGGRGLINQDEPEVKWQLLSGSNKTCDNETLFLKATAIFHEASGPILEKGNDLLPAMVEGGELSKQYFRGMYCAVITKNSEVLSSGLLRLFGRDVAELPLVAPHKECRGKGYLKVLIYIIEQLLISLYVKFLVLPTDEDAELFWINKLRFARINDVRVKQFTEYYWIIRFKEKIMLEKVLSPF